VHHKEKGQVHKEKEQLHKEKEQLHKEKQHHQQAIGAEPNNDRNNHKKCQ